MTKVPDTFVPILISEISMVSPDLHKVKTVLSKPVDFFEWVSGWMVHGTDFHCDPPNALSAFFWQSE